MYVLIAGGGKVGANVARTLLGLGHEVTIIDQRPERFRVLEEEFDYRVQRGDATELHVLERAGIGRPPNLVLAVTGDDEDNIVICEIARSRYHVPKVIARVNDPRNQEHFDLLGIAPTVCATSSILGLIEHEVPEHDLIHLLQLRNDDLEIVEVPIAANSPSAWKRVEQLDIPSGARLVSVARDGESAIAQGATELRPGDRVIAILQPGCEQALRDVLLKVKR
ncbi:MAG: potassium channel family protein [Gaiellaceae bacterium]